MRDLDPVILAIGEHPGLFGAGDLEPEPAMRPSVVRSALLRLTDEGVIDRVDDGRYRRVRGTPFDARYLAALIALTPDVSELAGARLAALGPGHLLWIRTFEERLMASFRSDVVPHAPDDVAEDFRLLLTTRPAMLMLSLPRVRRRDADAMDVARRRICADVLPYFEIHVAPHLPSEATQRFRFDVAGALPVHAWSAGPIES